MPVAFGTGPLLASDPFTYSSGALKDTAPWDGPMIPGNGDLQASGTTVTHGGSDGNYRDAYTAASYGDGDYIITVTTRPADTRRFFFHVNVQSPGTSGVDSWTLDFGPQSTTDRWRLRALIDTILQTSVIDTNVEGADGMRVGIRVNGTTLSAWIDTGGGWAQIGTDQTVTPLGEGRVGVETNGSACVLDGLEFRALEEASATPAPGGAQAGGVNPSARVAVGAPAAALGGGIAPLDGAPGSGSGSGEGSGSGAAIPEDVREVAFAQPLNLGASVTVRRYDFAQGHQVLYKAGLGHAAPTDPNDAGWTQAVNTPPESGEVVTLTVPLPANDTDYTLAVFGSDGVDDVTSPTSLTVAVFGVAPPTPGAVGSSWASMVIATARPGYPFLRVSNSPGMESPTGYDAGLSGVASWRLYINAGDVADPTRGVPLPSTGWPAGSAGRIIRRSLPLAEVDRWHQWAHRVRPT